MTISKNPPEIRQPDGHNSGDEHVENLYANLEDFIQRLVNISRKRKGMAANLIRRNAEVCECSHPEMHTSDLEVQPAMVEGEISQEDERSQGINRQ